MYSIRLEKVTFIRNNRKILDNISLSFPMGKTSCILGPSGCGKSTLLKLAAGLIPPSSGKIFINGINILSLHGKKMEEFRKNSGFIFQDSALWANKSVYENMELPLQAGNDILSAKEREDKILYLLKETGYSDSVHLRPAQLSNGERKMVSFARALINDPSLIYMDNPLILVDRHTYSKMEKMILKLHNSNGTIIANFSDIELTKSLADFAIVMKDGKIIGTGTVKDIENTKDMELYDVMKALFHLAQG